MPTMKLFKIPPTSILLTGKMSKEELAKHIRLVCLRNLHIYSRVWTAKGSLSVQLKSSGKIYLECTG